ncbi:MAG TPA: hypothetical protein VER03_03975 [Bryobacteraceae bacterium]|nr:hypothetical protein [Bryobacteraceae bacterium]
MKTGTVRAAVPDAVFTDRDRAGRDIDHLPTVVATRVRTSAGYSGTPLPKKLGIMGGFRVMAIGAPDSFEETLGALPEGAAFAHAGRPDVLVVFTTTQAELEARFPKAIQRADEKTRLWIAWPKKASGVRSDLNEDAVRNFGLGLGWVDYKVCAIDATWSGLLFAPRKATSR